MAQFETPDPRRHKRTPDEATQEAPAEPLPCPFCGATNVSVEEGSTFRWILVCCCECGAQCGERRKEITGPNDVSEPANIRRALEEWNIRADSLNQDVK